MKLTLLLTAFFSTVAVSCLSAAPVPCDLMPWTTRDGTLERLHGHVQGMCVGADAVYMTLHNGLYKFDWKGNLIRKVPADVHQGDICLWKDRLYTAVDLGNDVPLRGRIDVYDTNLNFITNAVFAKPADGIACIDGVLYVGLGPKGETMTSRRGAWFGKFDAASLAPLCEPFVVDPGFEVVAGVQNIATDGRSLYVNFYTPEMGTPCFFAFDRNFNVLGHDVFGWRHGMDVISWPAWPDRDDVLFAYVSTLGWMGQKKDGSTPPPQALVRYAAWKNGKMRDVTDWIIFRSPKYAERYRSRANPGTARAGCWTTEGFEAFRRGTFGNAGQNIYVSKKGVLQRIYQYDLDHNGWFDLAFANCQDFHESPPSYVYALDGTRVAELPGKSTIGSAVVDLNGDGVKDIVLAGNYDEVSPFAPADIYFGSRDAEYSEKYQIKLQSPRAQDCWWGRFRGEQRPSLVFALKRYGIVRLYEQSEIGFEWAKFTDLPIEAETLTATDLDGDGYDDLVTRVGDETRTRVFWGGKDGLSVSNATELAELDASEILNAEEQKILTSEMEHRDPPRRLLQSVRWNGRKCFTLSTGKKMIFVSATAGRALERVFEIEMPMAYAVAVGDFDRDGLDDLAFATQVKDQKDAAKQSSFVWFNSKEGFVAANRRTIETSSACCIDADGNRILFGQCEARRRFTNDALLYTVGRDRSLTLTRRFEGENMRRVFFVKSPGRETRILIVNNLARSSVGYDKSYVYWGTEGGYDPARRTIVPSWCAVDAMAADLDDDGWAELVIGNNSENSLNLDPGNHLHHFGPNGFEPERTQLLPTGIGWSTVAADFDRDGYLDLILVADHWNSLRYFHGGPNGYRDYETIEVVRPLSEMPKDKMAPAGGLRWFIAVDANADGWLDLALTTCKDRQFILWGGPEGFSMKRHREVAGVMCTGVRAADLSKNGYPEIIYGGHAYQPNGINVYRSPHMSYVYVFWNGPDGISESRKSTLRADAASHLCVGDFDRNGWLDVFSSSYNGELDRDINSFIYWNRGGSFRQFDRQDLITHAVSGCVPLDFNEDGYLDLALANHKIFCDHKGYSEVWWNGPEGFLPTRTTKLPTFGPHGMYAIEPGNQLTRGPEEYYYSETRVAERDLVVTAANVTAEIPPKCWVKVMMRANGGAWRDAVGFAARKGDALQYRLELGARNSLRSPRVTKVEILY